MDPMLMRANVPDGVSYGVIRHHVQSFEGDGADFLETANGVPDAIPMEGTVTITPTVGSMRWPHLVPPTTSIMARIVCPVIEGDLYPPNTTVEQVHAGSVMPGVAVVATDQPTALPDRVQYRVEWSLTSARVQPPSVVIDVPANGVVDLTTVLPASAEPGTVVVVSSEDRLAAEAAASQAVGARDAAISAADTAEGHVQAAQHEVVLAATQADRATQSALEAASSALAAQETLVDAEAVSAARNDAEAAATRATLAAAQAEPVLAALGDIQTILDSIVTGG